jgi:hypothetical protein
LFFVFFLHFQRKLQLSSSLNQIQAHLVVGALLGYPFEDLMGLYQGINGYNFATLNAPLDSQQAFVHILKFCDAIHTQRVQAMAKTEFIPFCGAHSFCP